MTPIESLIEEMKFRNNHEVVLRLQIMLVHEKYFMRKVAENAWDACKNYEDYQNHMNWMISNNSSPIDKQTYLNENHPL